MVEPLTPRKLLFVCSGNSCRSPMAMIVAEQLEAGTGKAIISDSAAGKFDPEKREFVAQKNPAGNAKTALEEKFNGPTRFQSYQPKPLTEDLIGKADKVIFLGAQFRKDAEEQFGGALEGKAMYYCTYENKQDSNDKERHEVPDPYDGESWPEYYGLPKPGKGIKSSYELVLKSMIEELYPALREELF